MRKITYGVAVAILAAVCLGLAFVGPSEDRSSGVQDILISHELDNQRAKGAPQQQVVNGWVARDLLALQADRENRLIDHQKRTNILLALLVIAVLMVPLIRKNSSPPVTASAQPLMTPEQQPPAARVRGHEQQANFPEQPTGREFPPAWPNR